MDETNDDMPVPVDPPRDAEIAELKAKLEAARDFAAAFEKFKSEWAAKEAAGFQIRRYAAYALPTGGIHAASTLAGGNVDHPPRTRDEGRIHVGDQY